MKKVFFKILLLNQMLFASFSNSEILDGSIPNDSKELNNAEFPKKLETVLDSLTLDGVLKNNKSITLYEVIVTLSNDNPDKTNNSSLCESPCHSYVVVPYKVSLRWDSNQNGKTPIVSNIEAAGYRWVLSGNQAIVIEAGAFRYKNVNALGLDQTQVGLGRVQANFKSEGETFIFFSTESTPITLGALQEKNAKGESVTPNILGAVFQISGKVGFNINLRNFLLPDHNIVGYAKIDGSLVRPEEPELDDNGSFGRDLFYTSQTQEISIGYRYGNIGAASVIWNQETIDGTKLGETPQFQDTIMIKIEGQL